MSTQHKKIFNTTKAPPIGPPTVSDGSAGAGGPAAHAAENVKLSGAETTLLGDEALADVRAPVTAMMTAQRQHDADDATLVLVVRP